jgi:hypothetical protein
MIRILKWTPAQSGEGVFLYATLGASAPRISGGTHRVEYFVGLTPERDEVASPLAGLALYAHDFDTSLDHGQSVPSDEPLWPGTPMRRFLVLRPQSPILGPIRVQGGAHVQLMQAIPIFDEEMTFNADNGVDALLSHWAAEGVPFWDSTRAIPSVPPG